MKKLFAAVFWVISIQLTAQETQSVTFQAELFSRHYWRGFVFGDAPAIEPQVTLQTGRFDLNIWAAYAFDDSYSEIDLIPSFTLGNYKLSLLEYYNPVPGTENRFFDFSGEGNRHSGEIAVNYNGMGKIPIRWMAAVFVYGDRHYDTNHAMFSTYLQAGYPFRLHGTEAELSVAVTPRESFYADRFAVVHAGFTLQDQLVLGQGGAIPLKFSLNANPFAQQVWVIFSIGIIRQVSRN